MLRVGIDNGHRGAIVGLDENYHCVFAETMPTTTMGTKKALDMRAFLAILKQLREVSKGTLFVVLEYAQVMPKQGAVSGYTTGYGYGAISMALMSLEIPHEIMRPKEWQTTIGVKIPAKVKGPQRKAAIKAAVIGTIERRLPSVGLIPPGCRVPHDGLADAAGMALAAFKVRPPAVRRPPARKP